MRSTFWRRQLSWNDKYICASLIFCRSYYSKTGLKRPLKIDKIKVLKTNRSLMKVESIAECSGSILQYFWPALSHNLSWKPIYGLLFEWPLKTGFTVQTWTYFATFLIPLFHTGHKSPESPWIDFFLIRGDSWGFIIFFSPIVRS